MPQLGESVAEGTIGKWLKKPGDHVAKYEPLLEVITDKVNAEVPSPVEGVLKEILVEEGATVPNNAEIAVIEEAGSAAAAEPGSPTAAGGAAEPPPTQEAGQAADGPAGSDERPERAAPRPEAAPAQAGTATATAENAATAATPATAATSATAATAAPPTTSRPADGNGRDASVSAPGDADARMTPAVRRLLREHGLQPQQIVGSGGGGRITREDVINFVEAQRTGPPVNGQSP